MEKAENVAVSGRFLFFYYRRTHILLQKSVEGFTRNMKKRILVLVISMFLCVQTVCAEGQTKKGPELSAPSALLMEASTGQVIFEEKADVSMPPASVTKVMTMLLIFDSLEAGRIHLEDSVTVSEYAASMGGSQVFLEPGETQTVDTMLKCIAVASANDACVAFHNRRH